MTFFSESFNSAINLILSGDPELAHIVILSLRVSISAVLAAAFFGIPVGFVLASRNFLFKRGIITLFHTLMSIPTVVIGLFVYAWISRRGVFGSWDLLYTPGAIIIGQALLVFPIIVSYSMSALARVDDRFRLTAMTLGAGRLHVALVVLNEAKLGILAAITGAFGRAISEVGISMMLGGNIRGYTRTMTTAMALEYDKGEFDLAVGLGIILLVISLIVNALLSYFHGKN